MSGSHVTMGELYADQSEDCSQISVMAASWKRSRNIAPGTRIADIVKKLGIEPADEIGIILLESRHAEPEQELKDGANLALFPLLGGG